MIALGSLLAALVVSQTQAPATIDVSAMLAKMSALTDGKQHYVVYVKGEHPVPDPVFWGDGKAFYRLDKSGGGATGTERWSVVFDDPRHPITRPSLTMSESGNHYDIECKGKQTFEAVAPETAAKMLAQATFYEPRWQRRPVALLRDDKGTYFYVDQARGPRGERRDVRVFSGAKGKMVLQPLKDLADDSAGLVLRTKNGELRLVINAPDPTAADGAKPPPSKWVNGKVTTELLKLNLDDPRNATLIMNDLGVYDGMPVGTPCDEVP